MASSTKEDIALHQLQAEQGPLLDKIDELRTIGVGGIVELPQLVVCGNQSSGKSSVLEAISRVRFPMKSNVCTRFPTEVVLRRHPAPRFKVSIEPGSSRTTKEDRQMIEAFAPAEVNSSDQLEALIERAKECMGITGEGFSDDVLKIEISGPDKPELTLVDLPGLYTSHSTSQDEQGIRTVHDITKNYMANKRSIILAVVSAKNDYHNQRVLNMAEEFDRSRERTIGIITQTDILEAHSDEETSWLQILKNEKVPLKLGWHALRNRSFETRKASDDERDRKEKEFFATGNWRSIAADYMGIDKLRRRLSAVLLKHIERNLPDLIVDLKEKILDRQSRLAKLGPSRGTLQQQKGFLLNISSSYERITAQALSGMYTDDFFGGVDLGTKPVYQDLRRLRAAIRALNEYFADAMDTIGCHQHIRESNDERFPLIMLGNPYRDIRVPKYRTRTDLESDVSMQARQNRGIELPGSANQLLVGKLFREQSEPWEEIARNHLIKSWDYAREFVGLLLQYLASDHTYSLLLSNVLDPELEKMKDHLLAKLDELTMYIKRGHPLPLGRTFLANIQKARSDRQIDRLKQHVQSGARPADDSITFERLRQANNEMESTSNQFAAADIVDQMQAYYDTAIITFIDNVATLGVENCLLDPLSSIFTSQTINNMEDKQVQDLAAEPSSVSDERQRMVRDLEKLQAGLRTLSKYNIRRVIAQPDSGTQTQSSREVPSPYKPGSVLASQAAPAGSVPNIVGPGPRVSPSPNAVFTTNTSTGNMGLFGNPKVSQPAIGKTGSPDVEPRSLFGSGGSLFKGGLSSNTSPFGSEKTPNSSSGGFGTYPLVDPTVPFFSHQSSPFLSSTAKKSQHRGRKPLK